MKKFAIFILLFSALIANPKGGEVVHGEASIHEGGTMMEVTSSDRAILEWNSFSIDAGEITRFIQPDESSAVLNRVTGSELSEIMGRLESNGHLYLVNPNGIVIGKEGRIDAAAFIASTLELSNNAFIEGELLGMEGAGKIVHLGKIETKNGPVALFGEFVESSGEILAEGGNVTIAAGKKVLFDPRGDHLFYIQSTMTEEFIPSVSLALSGSVESTEVVHKGGKVFLYSDHGIETDGALKTTTESGGEIHLIGETVGVLDGALIDSSSSNGGGAILIGGDYQGKNPEIPNAQAVFIAKDTKISANAIDAGDGGKVIVWSDRATRFYGDIDARGGKQSGDGGFVEVSGKYLGFHGFVDRRAPFGYAGTLLLDPTDVTISTSASTNSSFSTPNYSFSAATAIINTTELQTNLNTGNVNIDTDNAEAGTGTITLSNPLSWTGNNNLTLTANQSIAINSTITTTGTGNVSMTANSGGSATGSFDGITIAADVTLAGGDLTLTGTGGDTDSQNYGVFIDNSQLTTTGNGQIILNGTGGSTATGFANYGVYLLGADIFNVTSIPVTITGQGGTGSGGLHRGVQVSGSQSLLGDSTLTFSNCTGGTGGTGNIAVNIPTVTLSVAGASGQIVFSNITGGGSTSGGSYGINLDGSSLNAATITATGVSGGDGTASNYGIFITNSSTIGSASSVRTINLTATGGSGASATDTNYGIYVDSGSVVTGDGGAITLTGTGGGGNAGVSNLGIVLDTGGTLQGGSGSTITLSGTGGEGTGGSHYGVYISGGTITHTGSGAFTFSNCTGGTSSSGGSANHAIVLNSAISRSTGSFVFDTILGGTSASSNYGMLINGSGSISAPTIESATGTSITGGGGSSGGNLGIGLVGTIGASGNTINLSATGGGTGVGGHGIFVSDGSIVSGGSGTISISATGSQTASSAAHGILLNSGTISSGNGDVSITTTAGSGSGSYSLRTDTLSSITTSGTGSITLTDASTEGFVIQGGEVSSTSGDVTFDGALMLFNNATTYTAGGAMTFNDPITLAPLGGSRPDFAPTATGVLTFEGSIGSGNPPQSITASGSSIVFGSSATLATSENGSMTFNDDVSISGTGTMTFITATDNITFSGAINGTRDLDIDASGSVTLSGAIGGTTPPTSLTVSGASVSIGGSQTVAGNIGYTGDITTTAAATIQATGTGTIEINDALTLGGDATFQTNSGLIYFLDNVTATGPGAGFDDYNFTVNSGGVITFFSTDTLNARTVGASGGGNITLTSTASGLSDNIDIRYTTISATGALTITSQNASIILGLLTGPTVVCNSAALTAGQSISLSTDFDFTAASTANFLAGSGFIADTISRIRTTGSVDLNIVCDNRNPNPPNIGLNRISINQSATLSTGAGAKVMLYAARPVIFTNPTQTNSFPNTINGEAYTPGSFNSDFTIYTLGTNEFVGYWYLTQPPPDPPAFQVVFKAAGLATSSAVVELQEAIIEPLVDLDNYVDGLDDPQDKLAAPDPKASCRTPPAAVQKN